MLTIMSSAFELLFFITLSFVSYSNCGRVCLRSLTTVTGTFAPSHFCSGDVIFEDNFNVLNQNVWLLENSMGIGGGSKEFQWYVNDPMNAYTEEGILHIEPTFTADLYGEEFLYSGHVYIPPDKCTQNIFNGCNKTGDENNIINPIRSVRMNTMKSFAFKYGTVEIRAKIPTGDWLFPALWLNPRFTKFGPWPMSGEIDLMESRGNQQLYSGSVNVGAEQISSTLHFGPAAGVDAWKTAHCSNNMEINGYNFDFHIYRLTWTPVGFEFHVDNTLIGVIDAENGFFDRGHFHSSNYSNPWINGTNITPFDQEFYVIINLAVGGTSFFSDSFQNLPLPKPWLNTSKRPAAEFWESREQWIDTWNLKETDDAHFQIDYPRFTKFGPWPMSGEIDLMESRGNQQLYSGSVNVGAEQISSTLHFGPAAGVDAWKTAHCSNNMEINGYNFDFHIYRLTWTPAGFEFHVDNTLIGVIDAENGFFDRGHFHSSNYSNPWINGTNMTPFDQEFYVIINLAVGGTSFFSDSFQNLPLPKPWLNTSKRPAAEFWESREQWIDTWNLKETDDAHFQIDYVKIRAL